MNVTQQDNNSMLSNLDQRSEQSDIDEMNGRYLTFWTDDQLFGIPIENVVQIVNVQKITELPQFPKYAKGIINLRGSIIAVIDMRLRLGKQEIPYNERTCIIVTKIQKDLIGLIVDAVDEVTKIDPENITAPPKISESDATNAYLTGIAKSDDKVVLLLDSEKIMENNKILPVAQDNI